MVDQLGNCYFYPEYVKFVIGLHVRASARPHWVEISPTPAISCHLLAKG